MSFLSEKLKKYEWGIATLVITAVLIIGLWYMMKTNVFIPDNFNRARQNSVFIAKNIVDLTEESLGNLGAIAEADKNYQFQTALVLVRAELESLKEARLKALELTEELDMMSRATAGIRPKSARDLAIEAIRHELSLITHLVIYNDSLNGLLQTLELKFSGDISVDVDDVQIIVININQRTRDVNRLNELFKEKMNQFDKLVN